MHRDRQSQDLTLPCKGVGWAVKVLCVAVRRNGCQAKSGMALRSWASVAVGMLALHQAWRATSAHTIRARKQRKMSSSQAHAPARAKWGVRLRAAEGASTAGPPLCPTQPSCALRCRVLLPQPRMCPGAGEGGGEGLAWLPTSGKAWNAHGQGFTAMRVPARVCRSPVLPLRNLRSQLAAPQRSQRSGRW